ncbi:HAD-superfamily hydrolase, partial [Caulochytrium protostelioides]
MAQPDVVREKIRTILREGAHQLAVISDFDMTLTTYYQHDGQRSASSHQVFRSWPKIDPVFAATGDALYAKYYPIEVDPTISRHDKQHHMETWWDSIHAALVKSGITRSDLQDMIDHTPVTWREGADTIFSLCHSRGVPLLVISAGLADLIELIMAKAGFDRTNVTIVSNRMIFSDDAREVITGFASPSIHIFNKD